MRVLAAPVAIIGLAFRFPGDLSEEPELWSALRHGRDLVSRIPDDRWATGELLHENRSEPGRSVTFSAGVLSRIDEFDAGFFGISPREAAWLDPQQRLLLELSWEAMENAGVPPSRLAGTDCAVYVGISSLDYGTRSLDDLASISSHLMTGNTLSVAANRLSYVFDLRGPSLAVDTACSSSLVALHHACRVLQAGEANTALVGGVSLLLHPYPFVGFTRASMLSADGRCKVFDAAGNGYVRAEGGAAVLLKPLDRALADGDDIRAVILGSGVNTDGARKTGITIPSREGQSELMQSVLDRSGLSAADIDFVEAHGTGTAVGDPIETAAIGAVYGRGRANPLPIGSVKANLGHMEAASGMAGLVKTILVLKHRAVPAQIHLGTPNPRIDFSGLNLQPVTGYLEFDEARQRPLVAGVNSFGFGGANAHVLLQEHRSPDGEARVPAPETLPPLVLSARSDAALRALAGRYAELVADKAPQDYYDIAHGAACRRERLEKRLAVVAGTPREVAERLAATASGAVPDGVAIEEALPQPGGIGFVYSGNGAQWLGMGRRLLAESTRFSQLLADLDERLQPGAGFSLFDELQARCEATRIDDTVVAQPLLFAIQVALTQLLGEQGIEPAAVAGHSVGEVAAAWASGALGLDAAIRVIVARSRAQGETRGSGRMAAVGLSAEAMQSVLAGFDGELDIVVAGINSPQNITLSGSLADLERVQAHLAGKGIFFRLLDLDYAFHSCRMDPIRDALREDLADLRPEASNRAIHVSTVTGGTLGGEELGADYWWRNVREPVRFAAAVSHMAGLGCRVFIEIGPHAILQRYIGETLATAGVEARVLPTLRRGADGWDRFVETALRARLLVEKPEPGVHFPHPGRRVRLPTYPWQRERHWHPRTSESLLVTERRRVHPLLGWPIPEAAHAWENILDPLILPWLADHRVGGAIVFPGAAYAEMALAAAHEWLADAAPGFEGLDIVVPMVFDAEHARLLRFELDSRDGSFRIKSRQRLSTDPWTLHAAGRILRAESAVPEARIPPLPAVAEPLGHEDHYRLAAALGLDYGPVFRGLRVARLAGDCLEAEIDASGDRLGAGYFMHPALLDLCYQSLVDFFHDEIEAGQGVALLPVKMGRLQLHRLGQPERFRARLKRRGARSVLADFELFDAQGRLLASVSDCRFRVAPLTHRKSEKISRWRIHPWLQPHPADGLLAELPPLRQLLEHARSGATHQDAQRRAWFQEGLPLFEALVLSFAFEACRELRQTDALHLLTASAGPYGRWLTRLLQQEGLLLEQGTNLSLADAGSLPAAETIWRTLLHEQPACLPQLVLLGRVGRHLPQLLTQESDRQQFLGGLERSFATGMLHENDPAYCGIRSVIEDMLRQYARCLPPSRRLRVLEIAAGPSELPRVLLERLAEAQLDYVLVLPEAHAERQRAEYARYANLVVASLDDSSGQLSAGRPLPQRFDVVIARHTLHRRGNPRAALGQIHRWLADGGHLLIAERHADWSADFLHGIDSAWWHELAGNDVPVSSLLPPATWLEALQAEGFAEVQEFGEPAAGGLAEGAYLLLARRPQQGAAVLLAPDAASWLLLADAASAKWAGRFSARLESRGQQVRVASRLPGSDPAGIRHIVCLRGWGGGSGTSSALLSDTLADVQALVSQPGKPPRLWFITRGAAPTPELQPGFPPDPAQAAIWGFARVLMNEHPALDCTLIDLAKDPDTTDSLDRLENELLHPDDSREIVLTDAGRYTLVMHEENESRATVATEGERFRLDFHLPGQLRNLLWLAQEARELRADEVEVRVQAAGLNFRDVMYLMGLLPDEAVEKGFAGASLGLEFAGVVGRVGVRVQDFKAGDRVMGFGSACFASHVVTRADAVAPMPQEWSFDSAATVPTVFFTAWYALQHLADLQPGERVLIHGGAGGVGIAAIQIARHLGAEVFATAGSDDKRDFVHLLGAERVFDSRSLAFADEILVATQGEGVDVVLNSLAGEAIRRNLQILKPFGRFLELGKRDFFENTPIGLRPFKDNISYFGIDADQLLVARPKLAARLFREVMAMFREQALTPLPCRVFPAVRVVDAFRAMQQARHIGKVVVSLAGARPVIVRAAPPVQALSLPGDSTWLVTGGLSGFGLESARWLVARGVRHLALLGRRGMETPGAEEAIDELLGLGAEVRVHACDIASLPSLEHVLAELHKTMAPLRGVLHAAAVFDDAPLQNLDATRMQAVVAPKLVGAWNLHQATLDIPLEHFVLYSSVTTAIGNPGQANYVAANAGVEGLARMRRYMGLPASCIGWGPIADAGYLARNEAVRGALEQRLGKPPLATEQALAQLDRILSGGESTVVANFDWNTLARLLPSADSPRFALLNRNLEGGAPGGDGTDVRALIENKSLAEATAIIRQLIVQDVARILAIAVERIDPVRSLHDQGLDSLMAVELALGLEQRFGIRLPAMMLGESPTAEKVARSIVHRLLGDDEAEHSSAGELDAVVRDLAKRHGESVPAEDVEKIVEEARMITRQDTRSAP